MQAAAGPPPPSQTPLDIQGIRALLAQLLAQGQVTQALDLVVHLLCDLRDKQTALEHRLHKTLVQLQRRKSEKLDPAVLQLILGNLLDPLPTSAPAAPESVSESPPDAPAPPKPRPSRPRRGHIPDTVPREPIVLTPSAADCLCTRCQSPKVLIGSEVTEVLEYRPGGFVAVRYERQKFACAPCQDGVVIAPVPDKLIERGLPGPGLLADVVVRKYKDHCPLYRLSGIYARHGVHLAPSTLGDWVEAAAAILAPLALVLMAQVLKALVLSVDDTPLRVLDPSAPAGTKRGHLWALVGDGRAVFFFYSPDWKGDHIQAMLKERVGYIQGDGYAGFAALFSPTSLRIFVACWAHVRRKFVAALEAGDTRAAYPLRLIQKLYRIEHDATVTGVCATERTRLRQTLSRPLVDTLHAWLLSSPALQAPPKSPLGQALTYALRRWPALLPFLDDGHIPIDNNHVEREFRPVASGRVNWLFAGSDEGARRAAILYSLLGSCALAGIKDPWPYLRDVLQRLSQSWPQARIHELLPAAWAQEQRQHAQTQ
jgi:transposase